MSNRGALDPAIELAVDRLKGVDLRSRCSTLGLPEPSGGTIDVRLFGTDTRLDTDHWSLTDRTSGKPVRPGDLVLLLHYLACEVPVKPGGDLLSFRDLRSGEFYFGPFQRRTAKPLVDRFGNDLDALREHLQRFDHEFTEHGDLGARIHGMGHLWITLIYRVGDDEFPAAADVLFDPCMKRVFGAEDAAVMASRICIGLL